MKAYVIRKRNTSRLKKILAIVALVLIVVGLSVAFVLHRIYTTNLQPVNAGAAKEVVVAIPTGASLNEIASNLQNSKVIRASWAFEQYVRSEGLTDKLKAGTYRLNTNQSVQSIVKSITEGKVAVDLFTILPGQRLDQVRSAFVAAGFSPAAVDEALKPENYADHPALVDKPAGASLEGYLYPDSFQKTADTSPKTIVTASLDEMNTHLTTANRAAYAAEGLTTFKAITLASIVEREVASQQDRATAAQVFLLRMKNGMRLQSDVTVLYGQALAGKDLKEVDTSFDTPYNTFLHDGLPAGPISNVTKSGLEAVAQPSNTDYLYFVAGDGSDYGKTYFSRTLEEHKAAVAAHCKSCSQQ